MWAQINDEINLVDQVAAQPGAGDNWREIISRRQWVNVRHGYDDIRRKLCFVDGSEADCRLPEWNAAEGLPTRAGGREMSGFEWGA